MGKHLFFTAVFAFIFLLCSSQASAQWINTFPDGALSGASDFLNFSPSMIPASALHTESAGDTSISYFKSSLPAIDWLVGGNYGVVIPIFGERITLGQPNGFVDSVTIGIDSSLADTILVALLPVTIAPNGFYVMDAFSGVRYAVTFALGPIHSPTMLSVPFSHVPVPQNFVIAVESNIDYTKGQYKGVSLRGDIEATRVRTVDNTHSDFVFVTNSGQPFSSILDSIITLSGSSAPLFSNLDITAYVSYASSSVQELSPSPALSVFPNPASTRLTIQSSEGESSTVTLLDILGREAARVKINGTGTMDVSSIPSGRYQIVLYSPSRSITASVFIQH